MFGFVFGFKILVNELCVALKIALYVNVSGDTIDPCSLTW